MRYQIHLRVPRRVHVPAIRLYWNVVFEQIAGLGAPVDASPSLFLLTSQPAIHLPGADGQQLPLDFRPHREPPTDPRHPLRQERLQAHRPGIAGGLPDGGQHLQRLLAVAHSAPSPTRRWMLLRPWSIQQTNGVLPVVIRVGAEFVQNHSLGFSPRRSISTVDRSQVLPPPFVSQPRVLLFSVLVGLHSKWRDVTPFGYILRGAIREFDGK